MLAWTGERQIGTSLSDIRENHLHRYLWAASHIVPGSRILDCACGVGYGTAILAACARSVVGVDYSEEAIAFAGRHWNAPNIDYICADAEALPALDEFDVVVSFETLEHLDHPGKMLASVSAGMLIGSVPNEQRVPFHPDDFPFHKRHYMPAEIPGLLGNFQLRALYGQLQAHVIPFSAEVRTLVFIADHQPR